MIITIDGPVASGKSSIAALISQKLGCEHLNSGFLYRGIAYVLLNKSGYTLNSLSNIKGIKNSDIDALLSNHNFIYYYKNGMPGVIYDNVDITQFLKSDEIDQAASIVSANPYVRLRLLDFQREYAKNKSVVIDGRDAGSVVFPNADFKIYLTASPEVRAHRWLQHANSLAGSSFDSAPGYAEASTDGQDDRTSNFTLQEALREVNMRDQRDMTRNIAPLVIPDGAIVIDNSNLDLNQTLDKILGILS